MDVKMQKSLSVFISYSHKDRVLRDELDVHLSTLKRLNIISSWYDGDIIPGAEWETQILEHLKSAQIILLLLSADFIASDFCYSIEMMEAIARHDAGDAYVIPILLRPTDWKGTPFAKLKMLPTDAKAVTRWPTPYDDAFEDIIRGIRQVLDHLTDASAPIPFLSSLAQSDGDVENIPFSPNYLAEKERTQGGIQGLPPVVEQRPSAITQLVREVQAAFESQDWCSVEDKTTALMQIAPNAFTPTLWRKRGLALLAIGAPQLALEALERALKDEPHDIPTLQATGTALLETHQVEEACQAFGLAYSLAPYNDIPFRLRTLADLVEALSRAEKWDEAIRRAEEGVRLAPEDGSWQHRIQIVRLVPIQVQYDVAIQGQRWEEAQTACTKALRLAPGDEGWQQRQTQIGTARASAELRHRLTDGSYLEKKIRKEGVEAVVTELAQGKYDETLRNLTVAVRCGTEVLRQAPEEIWNQAKGRVNIALHSSYPRHMPRFDLRFATLFPGDEALVRVFVGHIYGVKDCVFSPDGCWVLSASQRQLRLWDIASGETVRVFKEHSNSLIGCAFSPDGQQALGASDHGTLGLWDVASGKIVHVIEGYAGGKYGYAFSPDGRQVLSASTDHTLQLWDVVSRETVRIFEGHTATVNGCTFSPDGRQALSAGNDYTLRLWDVASGETVRVFERDVNNCAFSSDGRQVLSEGYKNSVLHFWDMSTGETIHDFKVNAPVRDCALSPDGQWALSASTDKKLRLWDLNSGALARSFEHIDEVKGCAFSPDGRYALSASDDCTVRLWDLTSKAVTRSFEGHTAEVNGCALSPDGQYALSASSDGTLRLWSVASGETVRVFKGHAGKVAACAFSPDGQQALSIGDEMRLWDVAKGKMIYTFDGSGGDGCAFSPDGQRALSIGGHHGYDDLMLWNVATGMMIHKFWFRRVIHGTYVLPPSNNVSGGAFSPNGQQVVFGSHDGTLRLFDITSGEEIRVFNNKEDSAHRNRCVFRPNEQQVLSAGRDLLLWDVASGAMIRSLRGYGSEVNGCTFSSDGRHVLSASNDCTLRLWNVTSGRELACWTTDTPLLCCAIGPDNETVIAGDNMGGLHFLSIIT